MFVLVTAVCLSVGLSIRWWTKPYVTQYYWPDGTTKYEAWRQRTLTGHTVVLRRIGWYKNGQKSEDHDYSAGTALYWLPDGSPTSLVYAEIAFVNYDAMFSDPISSEEIERFRKLYPDFPKQRINAPQQRNERHP